MARRASSAFTVFLLGALTLLTGCDSDSSADTAARPAGSAKVRVVASTDVYGDIAKTIGANDVAVTSILSDPAQDPHSFEANPRTALSISRADLLIENGGGYDDFMDTLRKSSKTTAAVINVVELSGKKVSSGSELNEHVWYDLPTVQRLATDIAAALGKADPEHAPDYQRRARALSAQIDVLKARENAVATHAAGKAVGITEPVPLYMSTACGLVNRTPAKFSEAIEEGDDVAPAVLQQTLDLYRDHQVSALLYNEQTSGALTEQVKSAANQAGIPVVPVTETLPPGQHYLGWMRGNIAAIAAAVSR